MRSIARHNTDICISRCKMIFCSASPRTSVKKIGWDRPSVSPPTKLVKIKALYPISFSLRLSILLESCSPPTECRTDSSPCSLISSIKPLSVILSKTGSESWRQPSFRRSLRRPRDSQSPCVSPACSLRKRFSELSYVCSERSPVQTSRKNESLRQCPGFLAFVLTLSSQSIRNRSTK